LHAVTVPAVKLYTGSGAVVQLIVAAQPEEVVPASEVNTKHNAVPVDVIVPGFEVYTPIKGYAADGPS
jgi:hypothetical protein